MGRIPNNCVTCAYESCCNTAFNMPDCRFYYARKERTPFTIKLKKLFGKIFK